MRTPEEIKDSLRICGDNADLCESCAYVKSGCEVLMAKDALAYIEQLEQENAKLKAHMTPVAPVDVEGKVWTCPTCGNNLLWIWKDYPTEKTDLREGLPFCLSCGQRLKWSDDIERKYEKEQAEAILDDLFGGKGPKTVVEQIGGQSIHIGHVETLKL